ncbi:MAG: response regulator [Promethearchaeota archaeon]
MTEDINSNGQGKANHILIVDDEAEIRETMRDICEFYNFRVSEARDGIEALEQIRKTDYDIILLDVKMPRMNGIEVLKNIRNLDKLRDKVIIISAFIENDLLQELHQLGVRKILYKPIEFDALLNLIKSSSPSPEAKDLHYINDNKI